MHTLVWFLWAFGLMAVALGTRNPLYLLLLVLIVCTVREVLPKRRSGMSIIRFALFAVPASALFNALSVHFGETVLFTIPGNLPILSGPVTLEALTAAREALITVAVGDMPDQHRRFLVSFERGEPDWSLLGLNDIAELPAVRWRQQNLDTLSHDARAALVARLEQVLAE